jgi:hypothetical protein
MQDLKPRKELPALNTATFFCSGCSISPAPADGADCPTCTKVRKDPREPMPLKVHLIFALALLVLIAGLTVALRMAR